MYNIGIDLGGTFIKAGVVNEENEIIAKHMMESRVDTNIDGLCDGCSPGLLKMYQDYIDGKRELREINAEFRASYMSGAAGPDRAGCAFEE